MLETIQSKVDRVVANSEYKKNDINELIIEKIDTLTRDIESLKTKETNLSDDVNHLEAERTKVTDKLIEIDNVILQLKENVIEEKQVERKQCKYDRQGYCKESESCPFYHTNEMCEDYIRLGICYKETCRLRHPKPCRYRDQCYRGKVCRYLHYTRSCDRCERFSYKHYYCEICKKTFCQNCTVEEAHWKNIYTETNCEIPKCEHIHQ